MSHWNRNAWNPNGGRYATGAQQQAPSYYGGSYPVQQQRQQSKKDVLDSDDDDSSSSSSSSDGESERVVVGAAPRSGYTSSRTAAQGGPPPSGAKSSVLQARAQAKSQIIAGSSSHGGGGEGVSGDGGGSPPAPARNPPRQSSSTVSAASRLRSIQQQCRIDTLRASGNHAAAAIFEQAVLKANRQTSGGGSGGMLADNNCMADDASVGSVLTFATEATDMASVRHAAQKQQQHHQYGQQRQHFHHHTRKYRSNVPQPQPAANNATVTPTKDEEDNVAAAAAADTPETLPVTPSTPLESPFKTPTSEEDRVRPSKINFNDMLSICEEQDEDTGASESRMEMSMSRFSSGDLNSSRTSSNKRADVSSSSVDTSIYIDGARAAVRDGSMYASPPTPMIVSPGNKGLMNQSTCSDGNIIAHESASELDMRGVSIFNHSSDQLLKPGHVKSHQYSYPPTDSSSGTPSGLPMPSTDSYDYQVHHKDVDKSAVSDYTHTDKKQKCRMGSKLCLIITVPIVLGVLFGLAWFAFFAPNGWFTNSQAPSNVNVQQGDGGGIDTTSTTASPTTTPTWAPLPDVLEFEPETTGVAPKLGPSSGPAASPSSTPTTGPTASSTIAASKPVSTSKPTKAPTKAAVAATPKPSPAPTAFRGHETFSFYVMGDVPYTKDEEKLLIKQLKEINEGMSSDDALFIVHVGDILKREHYECAPKTYRNVADTFTERSPMPVIVLPGDNDIFDCDDPDDARDLWEDSFIGFEQNWNAMSNIPSRVVRQEKREENFAFTHADVLFLGLNIIGSSPESVKASDKRFDDCLDWIQEMVGSHLEGSLRAVVFFGHADKFPELFEKAEKMLSPTRIPTIYIHGNGHKWKLEKPISKWEEYLRIQVDQGGEAPPIKVTIRGTTPVARHSPLYASNINQHMHGTEMKIDRRGGRY